MTTTDRPIGPRERAWIAAAEAYETAQRLTEQAISTTCPEVEHFRGAEGADYCRRMAERARALDEGPEPWLVWKPCVPRDPGELSGICLAEGCLRADRDGITYHATPRDGGGVLRTDYLDDDDDYEETTWHDPPLGGTTLDEAKALCERHVRGRT